MRIALLSLVLAATALPAHADHEIGHTSVFARVGAPGMPEGVAVHDGVVWVGTHTSIRGNSGGGPSKVFGYDLGTGALVREITVAGQSSGTHGVLSIAFDAAGRLYVLDRNPSRLLRFDLSGADAVQETYAVFPELPTCRPVIGPDVECAPTTVDEPNFVDYFVFDSDGTAYVTDLQAATIYRVPPNGAPEIWFQDARLDGIFGANGIAIGPDGLLYFAMTGSQQPETAGLAIIYTLPRTAAPQASDLQTFHVFPEPAAGADGIAFGASGKLYVALAGANQVAVLNTDGTEAARFPDAVSNQLQEIPYDLPASVAFDGSGHLLVTNQSFFTATESHWAVLRAWVGDTERPLYRPVL